MLVRTQERSCRSDSRLRRKLSGMIGHRLLGTQRPQMVWVVLLSLRLKQESEREGCQNPTVGM